MATETKTDKFGNVTKTTTDDKGNVTGTERYNDTEYTRNTEGKLESKSRRTGQRNTSRGPVDSKVSLPSDNPDYTQAVTEAQAAGYSGKDIVNAAARNEKLTAAQNERVRQYVTQATEEGYSNKDIVNAAARGEPLLPSQSSKAREYIREAEAEGYTSVQALNAAARGEQLERREEIETNQPEPSSKQFGGIAISADTRTPTEKFLDRAAETQKGIAPSNETFAEGFKRTGIATAVGGVELTYGVAKSAVYEPIKAVWQIIRHPIQTAKGLYKLATDEGTQAEVTQAIQQEFKDKPARAIGETIGTLFQPELAEKVATKQPFKLRDITIPTEGGEVTGKVLAVEAGTKSVPLGSKIGAKALRFGAEITEEVKAFKEGTDFKPGTPTETQLYADALKKVQDAGTPIQVARREEAIQVGQTILKKTKGTQSKFISEAPLTTERLSQEGVQALLTVAQKEGASGSITFGSLSRRQQIPSSISRFQPRDVDIRLPDASPTALDRVIPNAVRSLEEVGYSSARRGRDKAGIPDETIEVKFAKAKPGETKFKAVAANQPGVYVKVAEFKGKGLATESATAEAVPDFVLGLPKEGEPIEINNRLTTPLDEELRGVMQGTVRVTKKDGIIDVYPPPKRQKDIGSTVISAETLKQSGADIGKELERFKQLYEYKEGAPSRVEFDFSPTTNTPSPNTPRPYARAPPSPRTVQAPPQKFESPTVESPQERSTSSSPIKQRFQSPSTTTRSPTEIKSPVSPIRSPSASSPAARSNIGSPRSPSGRSSPFGGSPPSPPSPSPPSPQPPRSPSPGSPPSPSRIPPPRVPTVVTPPIRPPTRPRLYVINRDKKKESVQGYDVFVRVRGRFKKVSTQSLPENEAINYGAYKVANTSAATFQVKPGNQIAQEGTFSIRQKLTDFVRKEGRTFVQKLGKRIQTSGEKKEITYKGIATNQARRKFGLRR